MPQVSALALPDDFVDGLVGRVVEAIGPQSEWRDIPGLARHYGVSERQIRQWRELGLPAVRTGKRLMVSIPEADSWLASRGRV